ISRKEPALDPAELAAARQADQEPRLDKSRLLGVTDDKPIAGPEENFDEAAAYAYLLVRVRSIPADVLRKQSRADITFVHMLRQSEKYRGEIVHVEGDLRRLRRVHAPRGLGGEGIRHTDEAGGLSRGDHSEPVLFVPNEFAP